jgi:protein-S-isoprenylcysteine O-methyltransferase Ste14
MAGYGNCSNGVLFTALTFLAMGASSAVFITLVTFFVKWQLYEADGALFAGIIVVMCISLLLLFYGLYASTCGSKYHKLILAIIYGIFALALGALGIVILTLHDKISDSVGKLFTENSDSQFVQKLESRLNCHNWTGCAHETLCCKDEFEKLYSSYGTPVGACLIVLFVALLVGDFFAWRWVCKKWRADEGTTAHGDTTTAPLTYSW